MTGDQSLVNAAELDFKYSFQGYPTSLSLRLSLGGVLVMNTLSIVYLLSRFVFSPKNFRSFISHCFVLLLIIILSIVNGSKEETRFKDKGDAKSGKHGLYIAVPCLATTNLMIITDIQILIQFRHHLVGY